MKKLLSVIVAFITMLVNTSVAQESVATSKNTEVCTERTDVHMVKWVYGELQELPEGDIYHCPFGLFVTTNVEVDSVLWSRNDYDDPESTLQDSVTCLNLNHSYTLTMQAWLNGESFYEEKSFIIKDYINDPFILTMDIDENNHPRFQFTNTNEHEILILYRSLDTVPLTPETEYLWEFIEGIFFYHAGTQTYIDESVTMSEDTIWNYIEIISDTCLNIQYLDVQPGLMMGTQPAPGGGWNLLMKSCMSTQKSADYSYAIYTIDGAGERHLFCDDDGHPMILPTSTSSIRLKEHPDAFYQGAVVRTDARDGTFEVVSYSNKVENPIPDINGIGESQSEISMYPNPAIGAFTIEAEGHVVICNALGQAVKEMVVSGKVTVELPCGMYYVKSGGVTEKIMVL